jgi:hypothetical protein
MSIMHPDTAHNGIIPFKMSSANLCFDQFIEGWTLSSFMREADPAPRIFEQRFSFDSPFANVPLVQVGDAGFDIDSCNIARLKVSSERIPPMASCRWWRLGGTPEIMRSR